MPYRGFRPFWSHQKGTKKWPTGLFGDPNIKPIYDGYDFGSSLATDQASVSKSRLRTRIHLFVMQWRISSVIWPVR